MHLGVCVVCVVRVSCILSLFVFVSLLTCAAQDPSVGDLAPLGNLHLPQHAGKTVRARGHRHRFHRGTPPTCTTRTRTRTTARAHAHALTKYYSNARWHKR